MEALGKFLPCLLAEVAGVLGSRGSFAQAGGEFVVAQLGAADAEHVEVAAGAADTRQVKQRGHKLAAGEIAGCAEDNDQARVTLGQYASGDGLGLGLNHRTHDSFTPKLKS